MKYLFLFALFITTPAYAEFGFDDGVRKPQSYVVAGDSVIDKEALDSIKDDLSNTDDDFIGEPISIEDDLPVGGPILPEEPIDPFTAPPVVEKPTKKVRKVVKRPSAVKIQRSIADDRIDDTYVQELVKDNFNFSSAIE